MPGTQTVGGHTTAVGDIPPSSLVIRVLQYTVNTTNTFDAAVQDNAAAFSRSAYCHSDHGRSRFRLRRFDRTSRTPPPPPQATGMRFLYLSVSMVGQKNELGEVGNEKQSFDAVLNRVIYLCQKTIKIWQPMLKLQAKMSGNFFLIRAARCNCTIIEPWIRIGYGYG